MSKRWMRLADEDYIYGDGVSLIEWANLIEEILPEHYTEIKIEKDLEKGFDYRRISRHASISTGQLRPCSGSSAVLESENEKKDAQTIAEYTVNYKKTHSQTLLPMLDEIVKMTELDLDTIDAIAIASGPGSFTGLRIGSATAKGLGLALKKPLVEVPTLEGLAYNLCGTEGLICPIMDARRGQVYTGIYACADNELKVMEEQMAVPIEELAEKLKKYNQKVTFLGDGVPAFRERLKNELLADMKIQFAPAHLNRQRAAAVGALGMNYYREGRTVTAMEHRPDYLRVSQAERERAEREKKGKIRSVDFD